MTNVSAEQKEPNGLGRAKNFLKDNWVLALPPVGMAVGLEGISSDSSVLAILGSSCAVAGIIETGFNASTYSKGGATASFALALAIGASGIDNALEDVRAREYKKTQVVYALPTLPADTVISSATYADKNCKGRKAGSSVQVTHDGTDYKIICP